MGGRIPYRADIDGLRCLSVLAVLAFHYGSRRLSGGFVGVDVFFVISGFVITSQLLSELKQDTFSLLTFYDRRIRRILPATLTVIAASLVAGSFLLPPADYARLGDSAIMSATGLANFYFYAHSGYFDAAHNSLPLLHTWSLAVEEQFYLVWPLLLALLVGTSKLSDRAVAFVLALIIGLSFAASALIVSRDQPWAFYMLPTRAWELGLGALLVTIPAVSSVVTAELMAASGIILIFCTAILLSATSQFPGMNALWPCVGAALIVMPKLHATLVSRALSWPPLVFLGKISFSLYLWHWPVLMFYTRYDLNVRSPAVTIILMIAVSLILAIVSYYFIEQPFRKLRPHRAATILTGALASASLCLVGLSVVRANGYPNRFSPESLKYYTYSAAKIPKQYSDCFLNKDIGPGSIYDEKKCLVISDTKPNVLIIGDSHAAHFVDALRNEFPGISFSQATAAGCAPVLPLRGSPSCMNLMRRVFQEFLVKHQFQDVIISARWGNKTIKDLSQTITSLAPKAGHVTVFGPNLEYIAPLPLVLGRSIDASDPALVKRASYADLTWEVTEKAERNLRGTGAQFLSVMSAECEQQKCKAITSTGEPMLFDEQHFTLAGATDVLRSLRRQGLFSWYTEPANLTDAGSRGRS